MRAAPEEREREARNGPEHRILVTAAFGCEEPSIGTVTQIGGKQQVNSEKDRYPSRVDAQDEGQPADRFVQHGDPGEPIRKPERGKIFRGPRHPEHGGLEVDAVQNEQRADAHAQQQCSIWGQLCVDHVFLPSVVLQAPALSVTGISTSLPSRRTVSLTVSPTWCSSRRLRSRDTPSTGLPSTAVMISPGTMLPSGPSFAPRRPAAAAGDPGLTLRMTTPFKPACRVMS